MNMEELERVREKYAKKLLIFISIGFGIFALAIIIGMLAFTNINSKLLSMVTPMAITGFFMVVAIMIAAYLLTRKEAAAYRKIYKA